MIPTRPTLVIICGLPATGKTTLASRLSHELGWPLFAKDRLKELLHDTREPDASPVSREASMALGRQAIRLAYALTEDVLAAGASCIVEGNFLPGLAATGMQPLLAMARGRQVHCTVDGEVLLARYRRRHEDGERHPVHVDRGYEGEVRARIGTEASEPIPLAVPLLRVDTTDGWSPPWPDIVSFCRA